MWYLQEILYRVIIIIIQVGFLLTVMSVYRKKQFIL